MKTKSEQLKHLKGELAYVLYWEQVYKCRPRLSTVETIDLNLEIIIDDRQTILAFRHDLPKDMMGQVLNAGHWQVYIEESQCIEAVQRLRSFIGRLRTDFCLN